MSALHLIYFTLILAASVPRVAFISGASRGIGRGIALALLKRGIVCVAVARDKNGLDEVKNAYPRLCHTLVLDLMQENALSTLIDYLQKKELMPQILIHNLGGQTPYDAQPLNKDVLLSAIMLNLGVSVMINEYFLPIMQKNRDGHIIHISSDCALDGYSPPAYCAAKAGLNAYVQSSARFYARDEICIQSVMPGIINFKGSAWDKKSRTHPHLYNERKAHLALGRFGRVDEIGEFVAMLCEKKNMLTTGANFLLNGGGYKRAGDRF